MYLVSKCSNVLNMYLIAYQLSITIFSSVILLMPMVLVKFDLLGLVIVKPLTFFSLGFLQVLFLMYHYFAAAEIYNAIRMFIAAYVWMTGFGNFSYYYIRKDFSVARFAQVIFVYT